MRYLQLSLWAVLAVAGFAATSSAESKFAENHPRRAEVNQRLKNQHNRVKAGVQNGSLTKGQAKQIKREDRSIHREEKRMAARDGGHITKADQAKLNRQENRVSNQINRDESANKAGAGASAPAAPTAPAQ